MDFERNIFTAENRKHVFGICHRILRDFHDAEDAAQDAFIKAYEALPRFRYDCTVTTWLYRIASNSALDHVRKRRGNLISLDCPSGEKGLSVGEVLPSREVDPDSKIFLFQIMRHLDESLRQVIRWNLHGYSYQEIGAAMGLLSVVCIQSRIVRARQQMRRTARRRK